MARSSTKSIQAQTSFIGFPSEAAGCMLSGIRSGWELNAGAQYPLVLSPVSLKPRGPFSPTKIDG
ncbi:MAG: hypothetical protein GY898_01145 [Proteobacteria bacterium]|nr:hypothetical protein [Pseudomonadota bacterium]